jgi:hypothetical protein
MQNYSWAIIGALAVGVGLLTMSSCAKAADVPWGLTESHGVLEVPDGRFHGPVQTWRPCNILRHCHHRTTKFHRG